MEKFYIKLENEWFQYDEEQTWLQMYGKDSLMLYAILKRDVTVRNYTKFTIKEILDILQISNTNTRMIQKIKETLIQMNGKLIDLYEDRNCIKEVKKLDNNTVYFALFKNESPEENFFIVTDDEIDKIINIATSKKIPKENILSQFLYICKSFNNNKNNETYKTCRVGIDTIEKYIDIDRKTVMRYNQLLENELLLLIHSEGATLNKDTYKTSCNIYARVNNVEEFNKVIELESKKKSIKSLNREKQDNLNKQRGLKQKINNYKKNKYIENNEDSWNELNKLEREYVELLFANNKKIKKGTGLVTIKLNGENKEFYRKSEEDIRAEEIARNNYKLLNTKINITDDILNPFRNYNI